MRNKPAKDSVRTGGDIERPRLEERFQPGPRSPRSKGVMRSDLRAILPDKGREGMGLEKKSGMGLAKKSPMRTHGIRSSVLSKEAGQRPNKPVTFHGPFGGKC